MFVDSIVVTVPPETLSRSARDALMRLERASDIKIEYLVEQIGLGQPGSRANEASRVMDLPHQDAVIAELLDDEMRELAHRPYLRLKRAIDFCVAAILLVVLAPGIAIVGILVLIDVGWPIMFWQVRPGWLGRPFRLYKLRTMRAAHTGDGVLVPDENRVSLLGRFLRRTRLDELPQLVNILAGDMSFVGPRPLLPIDQPPAFAARLLARPGLTGWAQVVGGRAISAAEKAMLDIWYVQNAHLLLDVYVVAQTIPMVVLGERTNEKVIERVREETQRHNRLQRAAR